MLHHKNIFEKKKELNKIHTHPMEGNWKFQGGGEGGGILEAKILEAKYEEYEAKVDFLGGGECKWGEYGYFLELHNILHII